MSTKCDREILNAVINPSIPIGEGIFDQECDESLKDPTYEDSPKFRESKRYEEMAIELAERGGENTSEALEHIKKAKDLTPDRASVYNNSAQIHRLANDLESALSDLNTALRLSGESGRSACQAFTQRGLIRYRLGEKESALEDFQKASKLGSSFAKSILTQLNPYAAMCNKMLKNVFRALEEGTERVENPFENPTCHKG